MAYVLHNVFQFVGQMLESVSNLEKKFFKSLNVYTRSLERLSKLVFCFCY